MKTPHINITFEENTVDLLNYLAKQEDKTISNLIKELVFEALDRREDMVLSAIAESRDTQHVKKIDHDEF